MKETNEILLMITGVLAICLAGLFCAYWLSRGRRFIYAGLSAVALFACSGYFLIPSPPVYEYHNVKVVQVIDTYTWRLAKADGEFVAPFCRDYDLKFYQPAPGVVLNKFRYQDLGQCWSVRRSDLGFWWKRDANGIAVKEN